MKTDISACTHGSINCHAQIINAHAIGSTYINVHASFYSKLLVHQFLITNALNRNGKGIWFSILTLNIGFYKLSFQLLLIPSWLRKQISKSCLFVTLNVRWCRSQTFSLATFSTFFVWSFYFLFRFSMSDTPLCFTVYIIWNDIYMYIMPIFPT